MNETIQTQLNHRTIRAFKDQTLTKEEVDLLVEVAQRTASSMYLQAYSIISVTDPELKKELAAVSGQSYVATSGHLFVFVVDQRRNTEIAKALGQEVGVQGSADRFVSGLTDAVIAAQNVVVAAESLGMGTVYLGSFFNDTAKIVELLNLPKYTYPAIGLAVGWPDQEPQLKPRLPKEVVHMENGYRELENPLEELKEYDATVTEYYDLRDANKRVDAFTKQVSTKYHTLGAKRAEMLGVLKAQGFLTEG